MRFEIECCHASAAWAYNCATMLPMLLVDHFFISCLFLNKDLHFQVMGLKLG